jgi:hypothetical protein
VLLQVELLQHQLLRREKDEEDERAGKKSTVNNQVRKWIFIHCDPFVFLLMRLTFISHEQKLL